MGKSSKAYKEQKDFCSKKKKKKKKKLKGFSIMLIRLWTINFYGKCSFLFKPFLSNKGNNGLQIKLVEKDELLQDDDLDCEGSQ